MTNLQKKLKTLTLAYLDKLIAYVGRLRDSGADTTLDQTLHAQRLRVSQTADLEVLLQFSDGRILAKHLERVDAIEEDLDDDERDDATRDRESDALDTYLEKVGQEIDAAREGVMRETGTRVAASTRENPFLDALAGHLEATGADVSLVLATFKKKSLSELLVARKKRKRWARTPAGKASIRRSKIRADRPHTINRQKSKTSKLAHRIYKY